MGITKAYSKTYGSLKSPKPKTLHRRHLRRQRRSDLLARWSEHEQGETYCSSQPDSSLPSVDRAEWPAKRRRSRSRTPPHEQLKEFMEKARSIESVNFIEVQLKRKESERLSPEEVDANIKNLNKRREDKPEKPESEAGTDPSSSRQPALQSRAHYHAGARMVPSALSCSIVPFCPLPQDSVVISNRCSQREHEDWSSGKQTALLGEARTRKPQQPTIGQYGLNLNPKP